MALAPDSAPVGGRGVVLLTLCDATTFLHLADSADCPAVCARVDLQPVTRFQSGQPDRETDPLNNRGYGRTHDFVGELRIGAVAVESDIAERGFAVEIGEIALTECETVNQFKGLKTEPLQFTRNWLNSVAPDRTTFPTTEAAALFARERRIVTACPVHRRPANQNRQGGPNRPVCRFIGRNESTVCKRMQGRTVKRSLANFPWILEAERDLRELTGSCVCVLFKACRRTSGKPLSN